MGVIFDRLVDWLAEDLSLLVDTGPKPKRAAPKPRSDNPPCQNCGGDMSLKDTRAKFCSRRCAGMAMAQRRWREKMEKESRR